MKHLVELTQEDEAPDLIYINTTNPRVDLSQTVISTEAFKPELSGRFGNQGSILLDFNSEGEVIGIELIGLKIPHHREK
jgi:uncharacterized protein YuzE